MANIIFSYYDEIDTSLLVEIFKSETIEFSSKINLLGKTVKRMDKDTLCLVLSGLGTDKIANNICGGQKKVAVTNENEQILRALFNADVIFKYELAADGQHYRTIKYRTRAKDESHPE